MKLSKQDAAFVAPIYAVPDTAYRAIQQTSEGWRGAAKRLIVGDLAMSANLEVSFVNEWLTRNGLTHEDVCQFITRMAEKGCDPYECFASALVGLQHGLLNPNYRELCSQKRNA